MLPIGHQFVDKGTENRLSVDTDFVTTVRRNYSDSKCGMQLALDSNKGQGSITLRIIFEFCSITKQIRTHLGQQTSEDASMNIGVSKPASN
jgi:hypothetical protein